MKIIKYEKLKNTLDSSILLESKIGLIHGCFNPMHIGHSSLLDFAASNCDILLLGLLDDDMISFYYKDSNQHYNLNDRISMLSSKNNSIDYLFVMPLHISSKINIELQHELIYKELRPSVVFSAKNDLDSQYKHNRCEKLCIDYVDFNPRHHQKTQFVYSEEDS